MNSILIKQHPILLLLLFLLFLPTSSQAFPKTDLDFMLLPPYCAARSGRTDQATEDYWKSVIGRKDWVHIHHYCSSLDRLNKARLLSTKERNVILESFVKKTSYMEKHGTRNFIFLPELYTKRGQSLVTMGKKKESISYFKQAIKANPNYSRNYKELSKVYTSLGNHKEAIAIVEQGLKQRPNSKMLLYRLKTLTK